MGAITNTDEKPGAKPTVSGYLAQVITPERERTLVESLPSHLRPAMFKRNIEIALMMRPDLMTYAPHLVYREVAKAAALGLLLDPTLGEGYILDVYNYKTRYVEPQFRPGYRGLLKLGRQSGEIKQIYAHEVCENDTCEISLGGEKTLLHKLPGFGDRGRVVGFYAVVKYGDDSMDFEPMSLEDVHRIRDRSEAWKAFKENKIRSTPWSTDEVEMGKKTVIRRLMKRIPMSPLLADAVRIDDEETGSAPMITSTAREVIPARPAAAQIAHTPADEQDYNSGGRREGQPEPEGERAPDPDGDQNVDTSSVGGDTPEEGEAWAQRTMDASRAAQEGEPSQEISAELEDELQAHEQFCRRVRGYDSLEKERDKWIARIQKEELPRAVGRRVQEAYEAACARIDKNEAAKGNEPKKPADKPAAAALAKAAPQANDDGAPDPDAAPNPDDDAPNPDVEHAAAASTPAEPAVDIDPKVRETALKKADNGSKRFSIWYRAQTEAHQKMIDAMGPELRPICEKADAEIAAEDGQR